MKKYVIGLLCFTLLAVGVTYGCIQYTLQVGDAKVDCAEVGIDLAGYYDENDLLITAVLDPEISGESNTYPQIDGLINQEVQAAINGDIYTHVQTMRETYAANGNFLRNLYYEVYANFGNVLSVGLFFGDGAWQYDAVYLNYNLNDGSTLRLEDLFGAQADVQRIVHSGFYDSLTRDSYYEEWQTVGSPDEQALYETVKHYMSREKKTFRFTPAEIFLYEGDHVAQISMADYADDIVVYHKFLGEEHIYQRDDIGNKGIFTCAAVNQGFGQRKLGFATEHFWYDIAMTEPYTDERLPDDVVQTFWAFRDRYYSKLMDEVETIKAQAQENPDKAFILLASPYINLYTHMERNGDDFVSIPSNAAMVTDYYTLYEMPAELFETQYLPALREQYRTNAYYLFYVGIDQAVEGDAAVQTTKRTEDVMYDCSTDALLTVADLFVDGIDYVWELRTEAQSQLVNFYGFTWAEAEAQVQQAQFSLNGGSIAVHIPVWGSEQCVMIAVDAFPMEQLTIFDGGMTE